MMPNNVFANGREISCKAADGKSICAFPDVCFTPPDKVPPTPPGVPIPYPNTGMAKDASKGSKSVKVSGKEVMLKNKSFFKKSVGDEAGCATKKGVVTSTNRGKIFFRSWSMDVKVEGQNVVRHMDMATHNHRSEGPNTPPWMYLDTMDVAPPGHPCKTEIDKAQRECKTSEVKDGKRVNCSDECKQAMNCILVPKRKDKKLCCDPHNTGHHLVPAHSCKGAISGYNEKDAPTVCAGGYSWHRNDKSSIPDDEKTHPQLHEIQDPIERKVIRAITSRGGDSKKPWKYKTVRNIGISAHRKVFKPPCDIGCLKSQLDAYHTSGPDDNPELKAKKYGNRIPPDDPVFKNYPV